MTGKAPFDRDRQRIDKPPRKADTDDPTGEQTDNPKLPKQSAGNEPTGKSGAKGRDALKQH